VSVPVGIARYGALSVVNFRVSPPGQAAAVSSGAPQFQENVAPIKVIAACLSVDG